MIEHNAWRGPHYSQCFEKQRVAIVGYSHYRKEKQADNRGFTTDAMECVIAGDQRGDALFSTIPGYFGFSNRADFWNRVLFFNFVPCCIGTVKEKFKNASEEQNKLGRDRFTRIIREAKPDKVFVFSTKGWRECPYTDEENRHGSSMPLEPVINLQRAS